MRFWQRILRVLKYNKIEVRKVKEGIYTDANAENPSYYYVSRSELVYDTDRKVLKVDFNIFMGSVKFVKFVPSLEGFLKFIEEESLDN